MKIFTPPTRCTVQSVNAALRSAGFRDIYIYRDTYNERRITSSHEYTEKSGRSYYVYRLTSARNARELADRFAAGEWQDKLDAAPTGANATQ